MGCPEKDHVFFKLKYWITLEIEHDEKRPSSSPSQANSSDLYIWNVKSFTKHLIYNKYRIGI